MEAGTNICLIRHEHMFYTARTYALYGTNIYRMTHTQCREGLHALPQKMTQPLKNIKN